MDSSVIIWLVVAIFLVWVFFFRQLNPTNKTDDQLWTMYRIALKGQSSRDMGVIEDEMKKRGLLADSDRFARDSSGMPHIDQVLAMRLRNDVRESYAKSWRVSEKEWEDDKRRHQTALTLVLIERLKKELGIDSVSHEMVDAMSFESIPFNILEPEAGKNAIVEYIVWKEYPALANVDLVKDAISIARKKGLDDILENMDKEKLGWLRWSELLDLSNL